METGGSSANTTDVKVTWSQWFFSKITSMPSKSPKEMESGTAAATTDVQVSWSQFFTDFAVVTKPGREFKVHKHVLAENSEFFKRLLSSECVETFSNKVKVEHFEEDTVIAFLEYIYAPVRDKQTIGLVRDVAGSDDYIYKRSFDLKKLTIDLLDMGHMYQVEDLQMDCAEHLKNNICDENVMDTWMAAEKCNLKSLSSKAIKHIANRPEDKKLMEVPGITEAFTNQDHLKDLVFELSEKCQTLTKENLRLKKEVEESKKADIILIIVKSSSSWYSHTGCWKDDIYVPVGITIETLLNEVKKKRQPPLGMKMELSDGLNILKKKSTLSENGITSGTTIFACL